MSMTLSRSEQQDLPIVDQIVDLVTQDVAGVHLYTMNNADTAKYIHQATHALFNHQSLG
ncbi:5,10-methylenetetrahydrofolate reductase [Streptococcus pneumoniae]|nr:5,10-methylenetetrahydrofolate reductase [Streptococcus pneumoniae]